MTSMFEILRKTAEGLRNPKWVPMEETPEQLEGGGCFLAFQSANIGQCEGEIAPIKVKTEGMDIVVNLCAIHALEMMGRNNES